MTKKLPVCLFLLACGVYAQGQQTAIDPKNPGYSPDVRAVTCGDPAHPRESFEPPCYARIFEDFKSRKRVVLYSPHHPYQFSRILEADPDSTIVIDFAEGLRLNKDLGLNNMIVRARLVHGDTTTPIQVINYAEIGKDQATQGSQKAFGFQTFEDVSDAIINLYYTTKDIAARIQPDQKLHCFDEALKADSPGLMPKECRIDLAEGALAKDQKEVTDRDARFAAALSLYEPEARKIIALFLSDANHTVAAQIAHRVFWVDYASLLAIAKQIQEGFDKLNDPKITDGKIAIRQQLLARIYNIINDLAEMKNEIDSLAKVAQNSKDPKTDLGGYCPATILSPPPFTPRLDPLNPQSYQSFALECFKESERRKYIHEVERYLVTGTISLRENRAAPGDVITIEIEARGTDADTRGAIGKFEIRVKNFGWKVAATDSLLFVERRFVTQKDEAQGIRKVRFRPVPGANLVANYYARGSSAWPDNDVQHAPLDKDRYQLSAAGPAHTFWRALSPGFGLNTSLLDFDDADGRIQLGVGPIVTLFDNRVSITYGWNLMARERRQYWGVGFSFLQVGKDVVGFFNKKQH